MPTPSYELTRLDANTFEHLANALALKVLGPGHTGFGPGPDGGRDGYFEGTAPYPSSENTWSGVWYIQSKFLAPNLSKTPQQWLLDRVKEELHEFTRSESKRVWPDNWIIVTNIEPSGAPETGSFDKARKLITAARPQLADHFHIWGGRKVLDLLALHPEIRDYYGEFVTPGQVLSKLYAKLTDSHTQAALVIRYLVVTQFNEQQYTKLEQAGSTTDNRPGIHRLFTDIPFISPLNKLSGMATVTLACSLAQNHRLDLISGDVETWKEWQRDPIRARTWFIKGGPGQGKSTLTQYICQVQRAALILHPNGPNVLPPQRALAEEIGAVAHLMGVWPVAPRVPLVVDLKEFAFWFGRKPAGTSDRMISFLSERLTSLIGDDVSAGILRKAFGSTRWVFVFDGLDEVPGDVKDAVANEVTHFANDLLVGCSADAAVICTSRPQGYSGQFAALEAAQIELPKLSRDQALACAEPLLGLDRSDTERRNYAETLREASLSPAIAEIMTTPLQAHIMAVIVRDGGKPPERKWQLFDTFYQVIKKREANRNLPDRKLAKLLQQEDKLLKAIHNRLGFELHARAETSQGAVTSLARTELLSIVKDVVSQLQDEGVPETVATVMRATTERLVLVSTPETGEHVRFDIRPLQEFFAAEHIYQSGEPNVFVDRVRVIAGDSHWREVMHFLLSALIEQNRKSELASAVFVLSQLDDAGDDIARVLNRRLARGGILGARLLQEGVLEQDKKIRAQFRSCISPLLGSIDADQYLLNVRSGHSSQWLRDVLIANLKEHSEPETVGTSITLAQILDDADVRSLKVKEHILHATDEYRSFFCESVGSRIERNVCASRWVTEVALRLVLKEDWWRSGYRALSGAYNILDAGHSCIREVAAHCGITSEAANVLADCTRTDRYGSDRKRELRFQFSEMQHGLFEMHYARPFQKLDWKSWSEKTWDALRKSTGVLQSIYRLFSFSCNLDEGSAKELLVSVGGRIEHFSMLPENVRRFFSDTITRERDEHAPFDKWLETKHPGFRRYYSLRPNIDSVSDWRSAIEKSTWMVLLLLGDADPKALEVFREESLQQLLIAQLDNKNILYQRVARWGILFGLPHGLGGKLRQLALYNSDAKVGTLFYPRELTSFRLKLPTEAPLLPHLIDAIVGSVTAAADPPGRRDSSIARRRDIAEIIGRFVDNTAELRAIVDRKDLPRRVRAAAAISFHFHRSSRGIGEQLLNAQQDFLSLDDPDEREWYLPAIGLLLTDAVAASSPIAMDTIGRLIDRARSNYGTRRAFNPVIQGWRELARAPVQQLASPELWV